MPKKPHHLVQMEENNSPGDMGGYFPDLNSSERYLENSQTNLAIQEDRIRAIKHALKSAKYNNILDFGIGAGHRFKLLNLNYKNLTGIDISEHMIKLCNKNLGNKQLNHDLFVGDQDSLDDIADDSFDLILLIHVLGYIPELEHDKLFRNLNRILVPKGKLLISTGNKLFDLFALNSGTKDFFESELGVDNSEILISRANSERFKNADRINPLQFGSFLKRFGFEEIRQTFSQFHHIPPQLLIESGTSIEEARILARSNHIDSNTFDDMQKWRALFQCSVVVSLSVKK